MTEEVKISLNTERTPLNINSVAYGVSSEEKQALVEINMNHEISIEEMQYETGDSIDSAAINQTITTEAKENSSYNAENKESKVEVVFEESLLNKRTDNVDELMGDL